MKKSLSMSTEESVQKKCFFHDSIESRLAQVILGRNIFTDADWMNYYNVKLTKSQIFEARKFPWNEDILNSPCPFNLGKKVKDTHFAFLGISNINSQPLTVAKWLELHPATGQPKFYFNTNPWHMGQPHTDVATMQLRWYLMLKGIVPNSTKKTPEEQALMLPKNYEIPTTIEEVSKNIIFFRKTGERLNELKWAACERIVMKIGKISAGCISCVGHFDKDGLGIIYCDGNHSDHIGIGASRKF